MKWFHNLKVSVKLLMGFIIVAVIAGIVGVVGVININTINTADTDLYVKNTVPLVQISNVSKAYDQTRVAFRDMLLDADGVNNDSNIATMRDSIKIMKDELDKFAATLQTDEGQERVGKLKAAIQDFEPYVENLIVLVKANQKEQAYNESQVKGKEIAKRINDEITALTGLKENIAKEKADSNTATANSATVIMIVVIAAGVIIAIFLGIFISSVISRPVGKLTAAADKLALGDVNINVQSDTKDEIGLLMKSFGKMIENIREQAGAVEKIASGDLTTQVSVKSQDDLLGKKLNEMIQTNNEILGNINSAAEQVATGSKQVSDSSIALSQGATEQASSIEELTASIEEISAQTKQNAQHANEANELAETAKKNAELGNRQMSEMLKAMQDINDSSGNISKIIKVIDEIAFQTNILALNAAVEAARAGQHGKGFAVVAEEVRNLAARSANAAKETTDMIEGSIRKVEDGTRIANQTAGALTSIVDGIAKVATLVNDIAIASNEQATGITQVNQGIMQVSQVVQTNSATSEESAAASEELSSQAELLKEQVRRFKLRKEVRSGSYKALENIDPEVLRLIESMNKNMKPDGYSQAEGTQSKGRAGRLNKLPLNETEFGKY